MKRVEKKKIRKIETTLGELVEAITQVAQQTGSSKQESYKIASITISDMLKNNTDEKQSS